MKAKQGTKPSERDIRRVRDEIRSSWSPEERNRREQLAGLRQEWLVSVLFSQPVETFIGVQPKDHYEATLKRLAA